MDIRSEECMGNIGTGVLHFSCDFLGGIQEVDGHELDARVCPGVGKGTTRSHYDFGPFFGQCGLFE